MRVRTVAALAAVIALAASGCWYQADMDGNRSSHNPFETTITADNVADLAPLFSVGDDQARDEFTAAVVGPHGVVVGLGDELRSIDRVTGATRWSHAIDAPATYPSTPLLDGTFVQGGGSDIVATAHQYLGGRYAPGPYADAGGTLVHVDAASGTITSTEQPAPVLHATRGTRWAGANMQNANADDVVRLMVGDFADLAYHWGGRVDAGIYRPVPHESLTLGPDRLYQRLNPARGQYPDVLAAYDLTEPCPFDETVDDTVCTPLWTTVLPSTNTSDLVLSDDGGTVFANGGYFAAYDAATGAQRWRSAASGGNPTPAVANGLVYVPTATGVDVLDADGCGAATCSPLWSVTASHAAAPVVAGDLLYTSRWTGTTHEAVAYPAAGCGAPTCEPIWSGPVSGQVSHLAVAFGRIYVTTRNGLFAFGLPT